MVELLGKRPFPGKADDMDKYLDAEVEFDPLIQARIIYLILHLGRPQIRTSEISSHC